MTGIHVYIKHLEYCTWVELHYPLYLELPIYSTMVFSRYNAWTPVAQLKTCYVMFVVCHVLHLMSSWSNLFLAYGA